jgi:hypothetical protein
MPILNGALLCDAAHDYNGLVSVLGGFINILNVPGFPVPAPIWYAARVAFSADEQLVEQREIIVRARDPRDQVLAEVRARLQRDDARVAQAAVLAPELAAGVNLVFPFPFPIASEGMYWVDLIVDGVTLSSLPLRVNLAQPNP